MKSRHLEKTQKFYDRLAPFWDYTFKLYYPVWKRIVTTARIQPGQKILEIGCGTGNLTILMAMAGAQVTAIDLSPNMLTLAEAKAKEIFFRKGNGRNQFFLKERPRRYLLTIKVLIWW